MKKSSIQQARYFRSTGRKIVMALALASAISGLAISPALADNNDGHDQGKHHKNYGQSKKHGDNEGYDGYRSEQGPYIYAQPVYAPPPVYYEPRPSPGISFFFPLDLR